MAKPTTSEMARSSGVHGLVPSQTVLDAADIVRVRDVSTTIRTRAAYDLVAPCNGLTRFQS